MWAIVLSFFLHCFTVQIEASIPSASERYYKHGHVTFTCVYVGAKHTPGGQLDYSVKVATVGKKELFAVVPPQDEPSLWATAITECQKVNLTTASIETPDEDKAVRRFLLKRARSGADVSFGWIGGSDYFSEGSWYWLGSKKPMTYKNWADGHPIQSTYYNCMYMSPRGGWQAHRCNVPHALAICQSTVEDTD